MFLVWPGLVERTVSTFLPLAPEGVPAEVKARINADVVKVIAAPEIRACFDTFGLRAWSPQEIAPSGDQAQRVSELVKRGNISLEREAYSEQMMRLMDFRVIVQTTILRLHYKLAL